MKRALRESFWLEAIAFRDAIISDRLEILLSTKRGSPERLRTASQAARAVRALPHGSSLDEILNRVITWQQSRIRVAHEMVMVADGEALTWRMRRAHARECAFEGARIVDVVDAAVRREKRVGATAGGR